jgi:hypothetical protein
MRKSGDPALGLAGEWMETANPKDRQAGMMTLSSVNGCYRSNFAKSQLSWRKVIFLLKTPLGVYIPLTNIFFSVQPHSAKFLQ